MKKNGKMLKGMTLIEMIISLAIFAIMSLVLLTIGQVVQQSPLAANRVTVADQIQLNADGEPATDSHGDLIALPTAELPSSPITITIGITANGSYELPNDPNDYSKGSHQENYNNPTQAINCVKYDTKQAVHDLDVSDGKPNDGLSLEFIEIVPTTAPTT